MRTNELMAILETAKQLGHTNMAIVLDTSRDGAESHSKAKATFVLNNSQRGSEAMLVISYEN